MPLNQQAMKGINVRRSGDPYCQGKIGLHLHNGGKKDYVYTVGGPLVLIVTKCFDSSQ